MIRCYSGSGWSTMKIKTRSSSTTATIAATALCILSKAKGNPLKHRENVLLSSLLFLIGRFDPVLCRSKRLQVFMNGDEIAVRHVLIRGPRHGGVGKYFSRTKPVDKCCVRP